jgi:protein LTV1
MLQFYEQYNDDEIGALDHEDIGGCVKSDSQVLTQAMEEFEKQQKQL